MPDEIDDIYNDPFTLLWGAIVTVILFQVSRREYGREHGREERSGEGSEGEHTASLAFLRFRCPCHSD